MKVYIIFLLMIVSCNNNKKIILNKNSADENLAIQIAEKKIDKVYGVSTVDSEKPLKAEKINDTIWSVHGTLPKGYIGGVVSSKVDIKNKKVVEFSHGK
jgi:hypothetical protein